MRYLIVSRHTAAVEFIKSAANRIDIPFPFFNAEVLDGNVTADQVRGNIVAGNIPLSLASVALEVWAVEFNGAPPRGQEYSAADMEAAGAKLVRYRVQELPTRFKCTRWGCAAEIAEEGGCCLECMQREGGEW